MDLTMADETLLGQTVARIDERTLLTAKSIEAVHDRLDSFGDMFVTREAFTPVQRIVYGLVGLVLSGVAAAIIALVVKK